MTKLYNWQNRERKLSKRNNKRSKMIGGKNNPYINEIQSERSIKSLAKLIDVECLNCGNKFKVNRKKKNKSCPVCGEKV